jgi:hypothetical protein
MHKSHFLTFGAGHPDYAITLKRISDNVHDSNLFTSITVHSGETLEAQYPDFIRDHGDFIAANKKGYGLWLWKAFLISKSLDLLPNDDVLVYLDAGCTLNYKTEESIAKFNYYVDLAFQQHILAFQRSDDHTYFKETTWSRKDLTDHLQLSTADLDSGQMEAGMSLWRIDDYSREFTYKWFHLMTANNYQFLVNPEPINRHPGYWEHRYDQAVFSAMYKSYGIQPLPAKYFGGQWETNGSAEPFWATRNKPIIK